LPTFSIERISQTSAATNQGSPLIMTVRTEAPRKSNCFSAGRVNGVDLWIVGTPPRKYYIIGYVTDSRPGGPIPMARRNPDMAAQARITTS
jgi:hypothetical protein